jgi:hypothetical protein
MLRSTCGDRSVCENTVDVVGPRQDEVVGGDPLALVVEQALGLVIQQALDVHGGVSSIVSWSFQVLSGLPG